MKYLMLVFAVFGMEVCWGAVGEKNLIAQRELNPKVNIGYKSQDGCSFMYSPIDFCDDRHMEAIRGALKDRAPNFANKFILITISERDEYNQVSVVAVDSVTAEVYPLPIDSISGVKGKTGKNGDINFKLNENKICIYGDVLIYKSIKERELCFVLEGGRFVGSHTAYMD